MPTTKLETTVYDDGVTISKIKNTMSPEMVCMTREQFSNPKNRYYFDGFIGDYILINAQERLAYVGKTTDFYKRFTDHSKNKAFWTRLICFRGTTSNLNDTRIGAIENDLISMVGYKLINQQMSSPNFQTEDDKEVVENWLDAIQKLIKVSVCPDLFEKSEPVAIEPIIEEPIEEKPIVPEPVKVVEPIVVKSDKPHAHYSTKNGFATGYINDKGGFTVLKGAKVNDAKTSLTPTQMEVRTKLVDDGKIKCGILTEDVAFDSHALASNIILGRSSNKNVEWVFKGVY